MKLGLLATGVAAILIGGGIAAWIFSPETDQALTEAAAINSACESTIGDIGQLLVPEYTEDICSNASQTLLIVEVGRYAAPTLLTLGAAAAIAGMVLWFQERKGNKAELNNQDSLEEKEFFTKSDEDWVYCRYCGRRRPSTQELCTSCGKSIIPPTSSKKICKHCKCQ